MPASRTRVVSLVALACAVSLFASSSAAEESPAAPAATAAAVAWMPIQIGMTKSFVHRTDRTLASAGTTLSQERLVGSREEETVAPPAEFATAAAEVRVVTRTQGGDSGEEVDTQLMYVTATPSAYQVHAAKIDSNGMAFLIQYPKPALALKENAKPGEKWHVSTENVAGLTGDTWGEVVGIQDARTPAGLFEKCLVIRYTGSVSGTLEIPGAGKMDVTSGSIETTEWHARGIGMVLSKEKITETLLAPNGVEVELSTDSQTALSKWSYGKTNPASAAR